MFQPGTLINQRYEIVGQVGQGGMGAVYEAVDTRLGHHVALKQTLINDPQFTRAFEREARLLAHLQHPYLPRVTDHFSDADGQFLVMDFIVGDDLATRLQQNGGPFPLAQVLTWADQLLEALEYLHGQQPPVLHRDIKPQNLKVSARNTVVLLDFGLAKGALWQTHLTGGGSVAGYTPAYAPLEQIQGTGTDARSDLYAVGATLYHLLVGTPPLDALTRTASLVRRQPDPLRPPHTRNPTIPAAVGAALVHAMELNPDDRPASATALRAALRGTPPPQSFAPTQVLSPLVQTTPPPFAVNTPPIALVPPKAVPKPRKSPLLWIISVLVFAMLGAGVFYFLLPSPFPVPPVFVSTTRPTAAAAVGTRSPQVAVTTAANPTVTPVKPATVAATTTTPGPQFEATGEYSSTEVIAQVGDGTVTRGDFVRLFQPGDDPAQVLNQMIQRELVVQAAAAEAVTIDEATITQQINDIKQSQAISDTAQFTAFLGHAKIGTEANLRRLIMRDLLIEQMILRHTTLEQVHARHILLATNGTTDTVKLDQLKAEANALMGELTGGADFVALAARRSDDTGSKGAGGDLGWVGRGLLIGPFDEAVFSMKVGERRLVQTDYGWHIIELLNAPEVRPLTDPKMLQTPPGQTAFNATFLPWIEGLQQQAQAAQKIKQRIPPDQLVARTTGARPIGLRTT